MRDWTNHPVSDLAVAVRDYLERNPHDAHQTPYWIGATLWAYDLYPGKPSPAEVSAALEELGGDRFLRGLRSRPHPERESLPDKASFYRPAIEKFARASRAYQERQREEAAV